jgi:hypothetical protein
MKGGEGREGGREGGEDMMQILEVVIDFLQLSRQGKARKARKRPKL